MSFLKMSSENKIVKIITESATLVGISAAVGYLGRKIIKEPLISDPSSNLMNYAKWTAVMAGSIYLRDYLELKKIIYSKLKKYLPTCKILFLNFSCSLKIE